MNRERYAILEKAFGAGARAAQVTLYLVAKDYGVSVDQVVQAGLGRSDVPDAARAAASIKVKVPDFFKALAALWPCVCGACKSDVARLNVCRECQTAKVCDACLGRYGCPACTEVARGRLAARQVASAEMEQNAKWLKRQLAQPLPVEPEGVEAHAPEPPPDPPTPPDAREPEPHPNPPGIAPRLSPAFLAVAESLDGGVE